MFITSCSNGEPVQRKRNPSLDDLDVEIKRANDAKRVPLLEEDDYARAHIAANEELWSKVGVLEDDNRVRNIVPHIESLFLTTTTSSKAKQQPTKRTVYLCCSQTDQAIASLWDKGWSCGYRNCQTIMAYLEKQMERGSAVLRRVPTVRGLQILLEEAWRDGFDPQGAFQLRHKVLGTQKWIGTTEVYTILAYLGVRSTILDFDANQTNTSHDIMMDWLQSYFAPGQKNSNSNNAFNALMQSSARSSKIVHVTNRPPVYMQNAGHSRTVVGMELHDNGTRHLVVLDPGRKTPRKTEQQSGGGSSRLTGVTLTSFRLDTNTIARKSQYQLLVPGHVRDGGSKGGAIEWVMNDGYLLTEWERDAARHVTSIRVT